MAPFAHRRRTYFLAFLAAIALSASASGSAGIGPAHDDPPGPCGTTAAAQVCFGTRTAGDPACSQPVSHGGVENGVFLSAMDADAFVGGTEDCDRSPHAWSSSRGARVRASVGGWSVSVEHARGQSWQENVGEEEFCSVAVGQSNPAGANGGGTAGCAFLSPALRVLDEAALLP